MPDVKLWDIWRPFKRENYRYAWNDRKFLGLLRQFCDDVKYTYQRARYGYCDIDLWNIDSWFLGIIPRMLEEHRDTRHGSPVVDGTDEKTCHDEWTKILNRMIFLFREASEDTCTKINPYEAEFEKALDDFTERFGVCGEGLMTDAEKEKAEKEELYTWHSVSELPEYEELCGKYFDEQRKIAEYREKCKDEALAMFTKYFYGLWD